MKFAPNASAPRRTVYATREVIIAAGSLHSAQLFQLSGIGPSALLERFNIPVAVDLPGVGNNLQDHCLVGTFYPCKSWNRFKQQPIHEVVDNNHTFPSPTSLTTNATFNAQAREEYERFKTGETVIELL